MTVGQGGMQGRGPEGVFLLFITAFYDSGAGRHAGTGTRGCISVVHNSIL